MRMIWRWVTAAVLDMRASSRGGVACQVMLANRKFYAASAAIQGLLLKALRLIRWVWRCVDRMAQIGVPGTLR